MRGKVALTAAIWWLQEAKHLLFQLPEGHPTPRFGDKGPGR